MKKIFVNFVVFASLVLSLFAVSGVTPAYAADPITYSPNPVTFTDQLVQTVNAAHNVPITITNVSGTDLQLGDIITYQASFVIAQNTCPKYDASDPTNTVFTAGTTCTVTLQFDPQVAGSNTGNLYVYSSSDSINPIATPLPLSGNGLAGTQLISKNGTYYGDFSLGTKVPAYWTKLGSWGTNDGRFCYLVYNSASCAVRIAKGTKKGLAYTVFQNGLAGNTLSFSVWTYGDNLPNTATTSIFIYFYKGTKLVYYPQPIYTHLTGTYGFSPVSTFFIVPKAYSKIIVRMYYQGTSGNLWFDDASLLWAP
jgi:hypothetical protein